MNLAVVLKLPALFIYENNGYGEATAASYAVGSKDIASRAGAFGMPAVKVDGADFFMTSPSIDRIPDIPPPLKYMLSEAGIDPASYEGPVDGIRDAVQKQARQHAESEGKDYSDLNDDQLTDDYNYLVFPNITLNTHADHLMLFRHRPHVSDPNKMYFDIWMLEYIVDKDKIPARRPKHKFYQAGEKSLGMVIDQDGANLPKVQQGMRSAAYEGLWLGDLEVRIRHFHKTLDDYIKEPG